MVSLRIRAIDLTLPLIVATAVVLAAVSPRLVDTSDAEIPVTGTVTDPCTTENVTFGGTASVVASSRPDGAAGFRVEVVADLSKAQATGESGTPYVLSGTVAGEVAAPPPLPTTVAVDGTGPIVARGEADTLAATIRVQLTVTEDGIVTPTSSAEVVSLECAE